MNDVIETYDVVISEDYPDTVINTTISPVVIPDGETIVFLFNQTELGILRVLIVDGLLVIDFEAFTDSAFAVILLEDGVEIFSATHVGGVSTHRFLVNQIALVGSLYRVQLEGGGQVMQEQAVFTRFFANEFSEEFE